MLKIELPSSPRLKPGTTLIGEYQGSGLKQPYYLARRSDGHVTQLSRLPYLVAQYMDGIRSYSDIAQLITVQTGRTITAEQVRHLIHTKLQPFGLADGAGPVVTPQSSTLALLVRQTIVSQQAAMRLASVFRPLFFPPIVIAVLLSSLVANVWLLTNSSLTAAIRHVFQHPTYVLLIFGLGLLSGLFHELGHATACRYGGATPGAIGVGIYLIWPAFYTNVTDSYRLAKTGRLRTDLGGVYFNLVFAQITASCYLLTKFEPLLLVTLFQYGAMIQQFMPFLRLDGYFVLGDLLGVPDLFSRMRPILRSLVPGSPVDRRVGELTTRVRAAVLAWVLLTIPILVLMFALLITQTPRILTTSWATFNNRLARLTTGGSVANRALAAFEILLLLVPLVGGALVYTRLLVAVGRRGTRWFSGRSRTAAMTIYEGRHYAGKHYKSGNRQPGTIAWRVRRWPRLATVLLSLAVMAGAAVFGYTELRSNGSATRPAVTVVSPVTAPPTISSPSASPPCQDNVVQFIYNVREVDHDGDELGTINDMALIRLGHSVLQEPSILETTRLFPLQRQQFIQAASKWLCH